MMRETDSQADDRILLYPMHDHVKAAPTHETKTVTSVIESSSTRLVGVERGRERT